MARKNEENTVNRIVARDANNRFTDAFKAHVCALYLAGNGAGTVAKILVSEGYDVSKSGVMSIITSAGIKESNRADTKGNAHHGTIEQRIAAVIFDVLLHNYQDSANKIALSAEQVRAQFPDVHDAAFSIYYNRGLGIARSKLDAIKKGL